MLQISLFPYDFDDETFVTLTVKFAIEDLLPGSRIETSIRNRDDHLVVQQQIFEMGIAVVFARAVMVILRVFGSDLLYPLHNVLPKAGLVVIDYHSGSDMHRRDKRESFLDAALCDNVLHLLGDRHKFFPLLGMEGEVGGMRFHAILLQIHRPSGVWRLVMKDKVSATDMIQHKRLSAGCA